jgi:hypothetical protein
MVRGLRNVTVRTVPIGSLAPFSAGVRSTSRVFGREVDRCLQRFPWQVVPPVTL